MKNKRFIYAMAFCLAILTSGVLWALIPPPPVNQNIGRFDTRFNNLTEPECRFCHNQNPPDGIPVDPTYLPDRHHLLVGTTIPFPTVVPDPDSDGDTVNDTIYGCLNCHLDDPDTPIIEFVVTRDCMVCHRQLFGDHHGYSPHHSTPLAQADLDNDGVRDTNADGDPVTYCSECHGSLVTDLGDGHIIPTYNPSLVTPWRSQKVNGDSSRVNSRGTEAGNCNYCHDSGTAEDGREVVDNLLSHHGAGFFQGYMGTGPCEWCHYDYPNTSPTTRSGFDIRTCEGCHGYESLHNIALDSDATGLVDTNGDGIVDTENLGNIIAGAENPFYSHIGNNEDCLGCHGADTTSASAPGSGLAIPDIHTYIPSVVIAGEDTKITLSGAAFTNIINTPEGPITLTSDVVLEDREGTRTTLVPALITQSLMEVYVPSSLQAGNYTLRAEKGTKYSSKNVLVVKPPVAITDVSCSKKKKILTVSGTGFTEKPGGTDADLNVEINGVVVGTADLISWSDSQIRVSVDRCSSRDAVTVNALFGSASNGKPCKGKKCR